MRLLLDINVILDVVLERTSWMAESARLLAAVELGQVQASVAGHTLTTVYYMTRISRDRRAAVSAIGDLLEIVDVVPVEQADFRAALALGLADFEDAVQAACALKVGADVLVTRNARDFGGLSIPVEPPGVVLAML